MSNIPQVVKNKINMTTFNSGIIASSLEEVLSGFGPFTVFAPSDLAFGKLESGVIENLLKPENKMRLADLLNQHIVSGKLNFKDLKDGEKLKTVSGKELSVQVKGDKVSVNDAPIQKHPTV